VFVGGGLRWCDSGNENKNTFSPLTSAAPFTLDTLKPNAGGSDLGLGTMPHGCSYSEPHARVAVGSIERRESPAIHARGAKTHAR
jgi:hypothetical protein